MYDNEERFDFESVEEYDEDLDFKNLKPCPKCKKPIPQNAISCLYCGESVSFSTRPKWIVWAALFAAVCFLLLVLFWR